MSEKPKVSENPEEEPSFEELFAEWEKNEEEKVRRKQEKKEPKMEKPPKSVEDHVWERVDALANEKQQLLQENEQRYKIAQELRGDPAQRDKHSRESRAYWDAQDRIQTISDEEEALGTLLHQLELGEITEEDARKTLGIQVDQQKERRTDPSSRGKVRTGRHAKRIVGNFAAEDAEEAFYDATSETHGGKVRGNRRKRSKGKHKGYTTQSGKKIRKV